MVGLLELVPILITLLGTILFLKVISKKKGEQENLNDFNDKKLKKSIVVFVSTVALLFLYNAYNSNYGYKGVAPKTVVVTEEKHKELYIDKPPVPEVKSLTKRTSVESIEERRLERIEKAKIEQSE